jgi:hypothetical protein
MVKAWKPEYLAMEFIDGSTTFLNSEILPPYPKSWFTELCKKTFPESHREFGGV